MGVLEVLKKWRKSAINYKTEGKIMENKEEMCNGLTNDRELLKEEILKCIDRLDTERVKLLYITAKIWEGRFNGTATE